MLCRSRYLVVFLLTTVAALAQMRQQDPIGAAIQEYQQLRREGRNDEAMTQREEIRSLFEKAPVEAPQFAYWLQNVTQMYETAGKTAVVRSIAQAALARAGRLPDGHPTRMMLLSMPANSWQREGNLLKA